MTTNSVFDILFRRSQRCVSALFTEEYGIIDNPQPPEAKDIGKVRERDVWLLSKCILPHCYSQWGNFQCYSTDTSVNFPISFTRAPATLLLLPWSLSGQIVTWASAAPTTSSFKARNSHNAPVSTSWFTIGN